ncbi:MAG TPA: DUF3499 family protein [Propionibacteriaceae bacterium]|nr:DUF3499 family protein [Propionibacteriaceae bacterium]
MPASPRPRRCNRSGCAGAAIASLTYSYADRQVVLGPLSIQREPSVWDLCRVHAETLTVPVGWEIIRLPLEQTSPGPSLDDLDALAAAVRAVGLRHDDPDLLGVESGDPVVPGIVRLDEHRRRKRFAQA